MAGPAAHGELTVTPPRPVRFALARPEMDCSIRSLLRDNPLGGAIQVSFEREPDYFHGENIVGIDRTVIAMQNETVVCMGKCSTHDRWVNGRVLPVGYLGELRLDRRAQGRFDILRAGYDFFRATQSENPAACYFTSIATDNLRARSLLERGARGLPRYRFLTDFVTLLIPVRRRSPASLPHGLCLASGKDVPIERLVAFLNEQGSRHLLATAWSPEVLLGLARHGLPSERIAVMLHGSRIVACTGVWDQRSFRQTVVRGYRPLLARIRPLLNVVAQLTRTARLPAVGTVVPQAFLSPFACEPGFETAIPPLIEAAFALASPLGAELVTLGLNALDPRLKLIRRRYRPREYQTRLYQVGWAETSSTALLPPGGPYFPEISLL